ncbi:hypothetical protein Peur_062484 [Populus x canadensis]|jgi:hypothetical protein
MIYVSLLQRDYVFLTSMLIIERIFVLDQRNNESIDRTFKGVAELFSKVFFKLVQSGHGYDEEKGYLKEPLMS